MLDYQLHGGSSEGMHLTNLLLHATNTVLLFLLFRRMTGALWRSAFVAAVFALHPLHVESVAWVAERKDVLSTFFGLLAIGAYARYAAKSKVQGSKFNVRGSRFPLSIRHPRSSLWYVLSLLIFMCSLMSKSMLVIFPFVRLLLDYWPLRRLELPSADARVRGSRFKVQGSKVLRLLVEKLPFLAITAASCVVTFLVQKQPGAVPSADLLSVGSRVSNAPVAYCAYIAKPFWPLHLSVFYP